MAETVMRVAAGVSWALRSKREEEGGGTLRRRRHFFAKLGIACSSVRHCESCERSTDILSCSWSCSNRSHTSDSQLFTCTAETEPSA